MNTSDLDVDVDVEIGQIILNSISRVPDNKRCFTLLCGVVSTSNFHSDELSRRLPAIAARLWPELEFAGTTTELMAWSFDSMSSGRANVAVGRAFAEEFPAQFALAHRMLAEYELCAIEKEKRELKRLLALAKTDASWKEAIRSTHASTMIHHINRFRFTSDATIMYEQHCWQAQVRSAGYLAGSDPELAIRQLNSLFARPVSFQYDQNQGRKHLMWLARLVVDQSWLLSDYPEDVTFYREFVRRMQQV